MLLCLVRLCISDLAATSLLQDAALFAGIARQACSPGFMAAAAPQALVNILWACAKLRHVDRQLFSLAAAHVVSDGSGCLNAQDVSNSLWAFAAAGCYNASLCEALCDRARRILPDFTMQVR